MRNKSKLFNVIMIALIVVIAVSGVMLVGSTRGWFDKAESADTAVTMNQTGSVNIERSGVAYSISGETYLRDGDILETKTGSGVTITSGKNTFTLNENSEFKLITADNGAFSFELTKGEVFANVENGKSFNGLTISGKTVTVEGTVFSADVQTGSWNVRVFEGKVNAGGKTAEGGQIINFVQSAGSVSSLTASSLNEFNITQAKAVGSDRELCFTTAELDKVVADREEEVRKAAEEQAKHEAEIIAQGGTEAVATTKQGAAPLTDENGKPITNVLTCTIQIRCDTILDNMGNLTEGKNKYVPSNGVILGTSTVQFVEGETVYDVLKRACSAAGIQLEYSWTPMYNSYYIEGINHLYEFDCGNESGWMYKVNGWFPNYGCSAYTLKGGDVIVWCYTCNGLGADVGGSVY